MNFNDVSNKLNSYHEGFNFSTSSSGKCQRQTLGSRLERRRSEIIQKQEKESKQRLAKRRENRTTRETAESKQSDMSLEVYLQLVQHSVQKTPMDQLSQQLGNFNFTTNNAKPISDDTSIFSDSEDCPSYPNIMVNAHVHAHVPPPFRIPDYDDGSDDSSEEDDKGDENVPDSKQEYEEYYNGDDEADKVENDE